MLQNRDAEAQFFKIFFGHFSRADEAVLNLRIFQIEEVNDENGNRDHQNSGNNNEIEIQKQIKDRVNRSRDEEPLCDGNGLENGLLTNTQKRSERGKGAVLTLFDFVIGYNGFGKE